MSNKIKGNQKHLTEENREYIADALSKNIPFKEIAESLGKDPTTIPKEVKKHRVKSIPPYFNNSSRNRCLHRSNCSKKKVCGALDCYRLCCSCTKCNAHCADFYKEICRKVTHAPYVCNGCDRRIRCQLEKYFYRSRTAHKEYLETLSDSRLGINLTREELSDLDNLISPLIQRGQPLAHIYAGHPDEIPCSERTLYNYMERNILSVANIDLPRKVRYKKRKKDSNKILLRNFKGRNGRTYDDFMVFISENPDLPILEMDTVEGTKGGKVLLTMLFRSCRLMLAFILDDKTQQSVLTVFERLEELLGSEPFAKIFPLILTDNGSEFLQPEALETGIGGNQRTRIFYCNANAAYQKGMLEKNHEFIRYIIPKGKSFDSYTQKDIDKMVNHINSVSRDSLNSWTPFEAATVLISPLLAEKLSLIKIEHDQVLLKPELLRSKKK